MPGSDQPSKRVFISYSHDSQAHKDWVLGLAEYLTVNGIEVLLDQWDVGLGDDLAAFMEKAVGVKGEMFGRALKSGVKMPLGTDAVAGAHGQNAREIIARVQEGQAPMDGIISATSLAAESMRLDKEIGTLASGFEADIAAVSGNPLQDITKLRSVVFVMKGGTVHKKPGS